MKFKKIQRFVTLSSFLVLTTFIVCVSVYAISAHCPKGKVKKNALTMKASMNNYGVDDGQYVLHARVNPPGVTARRNYTTQNLSLSVSAVGSKSIGGYASAYVDGTDPSTDKFYSRYHDRSHSPEK